MNIEEARKAVERDKKPKENYLVITFGYDMKVVLPYKDVPPLLAALANAEQMVDAYSKPDHGYIRSVKPGKINFSILSGYDYGRAKMAELLGISLADLEKAEEEELQKDREPPAP